MSASIVVIGGGIGGLVLAVALEKAGFTVEVVERRARFGDEGAGITLGPNAMAMLDALGLAEPLRARGQPVAAMRLADPRGRTLSALAFAAPGGVALHRAALHEVLRSAVAGPVTHGVGPVAIETGPTSTTIRLDDGTERRCALLVGADGIQSAVRGLVFGDIPLRYSGYTCWRVVVARDVVDAPVEVWGRGVRAGVVPLGPGCTYAYFTANAPRRAPAPFHDLAGFRATFAGLGEPVDAVLDAVPSLEALMHNDLEDVLAPRWWRDRVVLLGDAAHATTPNMGQGAGMAIEDAPVLAQMLRLHGIGEEALRRYQDARFDRARAIRSQSWQIGWAGQLAWPPAVALRDLIMRLTPAAVGQQRVDALIAGAPRLA